jgi:hypothetical protein
MDANVEPPDESVSYIRHETERASFRRKGMGINRSQGQEQAQWGLCLSGGGIRSATFCLGAMQGLSCSHPPPTATAPGAGDSPKAARDSLLGQFDYVSTVSGGGYIGSFFGSLFVRDRLDNKSANLDNERTAAQAYEVFRTEPPGRLRSDVFYEQTEPGKAPLAWLRENGRYMAPTGSGDMVYALALAVRNWFGLQYVLGTILLSVFALLALARTGLIYGSYLIDNKWLTIYREHEEKLLSSAIFAAGEKVIWWSPVWWLLLVLVVLWIAPSATAFWLTHPRPGGTLADKPRFTLASSLTAAIGGLFVWVAFWLAAGGDPSWQRVVWALAACAALAVVTIMWYAYTIAGSPSISAQRVTLTRALARGFIWASVITVIAFVETAAQTAYVWIGSGAWLAPTAATGAMVWVARQLMPLLIPSDEKGKKVKVPLNALISVGSFVLLCVVAMIWSMAMLWLQWRGSDPTLGAAFSAQASREMFMLVASVAGTAVAMTLIGGHFPGFLNLSTLQGLYSARLTRAYLGGSNGKRLDREASKDSERSAAEPMQSDHLRYGAYHSNPLGPMHIINVCLNQNVDPAEQLVQRDRKGRPLAILPSRLDETNDPAIRTRFAIDGTPGPCAESRKEGEDTLGIGEWVGVSGAAFSTGLGRQTTIGTSVLMALANVRLGRWWISGVPAKKPDHNRTGYYLRKFFKTQAYLIDEMFAQYYGTRRPMHYLSDGGHFENTGVYELLRKERGLKLIVMADCGCDPTYEFEDLANLIRLARIDFSVEIEVERSVAHPSHTLGGVFGVPEDFDPGRANKVVEKCAMLLNVYFRQSNKTDTPDIRIVLLKPNLIETAAADLKQYQAQRDSFPQETTIDQFYDEAQWESYRKLGLEISSRVFIGPNDDDKQKQKQKRSQYRLALWEELLNTR